MEQETPQMEQETPQMEQETEELRAYFIGTVRTRIPIEDPGIKEGYIKGFPNKFRLKPFIEKPVKLLETLHADRYPSFAQCLPLFKVEDGQMFHLASALNGQKLEELAVAKPGKFYDSTAKHLLSKYYQTVIIDLVLLVRHLSRGTISYTLTGNIFVVDDLTPKTSLVDFGDGMILSVKDQWIRLASYIREINRLCGYQAGENTEMKTFLSYLDGGCQVSTGEKKNKLASMPLFWTLEERRIFTGDMSDIKKHKGKTVHLYQNKKVFTAVPSLWKVQIDSKVPYMVEAADKFDNQTNVGAGNPPAHKGLSAADKKENDTWLCLSCERKWYFHFSRLRENLQNLLNIEAADLEEANQFNRGPYWNKVKDNDGDPLKSVDLVKARFRPLYIRDKGRIKKARDAIARGQVDDEHKVQLIFEQVYPKHIEELWIAGRRIECALLGGTYVFKENMLVPVKKVLSNVVYSPEINNYITEHEHVL